MIFKPSSNPSDDAVLLRWAVSKLFKIFSTSDCTVILSNNYAGAIESGQYTISLCCGLKFNRCLMAETGLPQRCFVSDKVAVFRNLNTGNRPNLSIDRSLDASQRGYEAVTAIIVIAVLARRERCVVVRQQQFRYLCRPFQQARSTRRAPAASGCSE